MRAAYKTSLATDLLLVFTLTPMHATWVWEQPCHNLQIFQYFISNLLKAALHFQFSHCSKLA